MVRQTFSGRELGAIVLLAAAVVLTAAIAAQLSSGVRPGPLQPTGTVNSFGMFADDGSTVSFVIEYRGEEVVTATLDSVALGSPDSGLELIASGLLADGYPGSYIAPEFPSGRLQPIAGTTVVTAPGDPSADVFFDLGIRANLASTPQSVRGVWLDYTVGTTRFRALLPWLLTICRTPVSGTCIGLRGDEFSFPVP